MSIEEAIQFGQRIGSFKVEYKNGNGEWKTFDQGTTIGAKRLCRKKAVKADKLRITVTAHNQAENKVPILSEIGVYEAAEGLNLERVSRQVCRRKMTVDLRLAADGIRKRTIR